jgi:hypothetical protein
VDQKNIVFATALLSIVSVASLASAKERHIFKGIEGSLLLGAQYDDNVNNYSQKYYSRFLNSEDPGRFHIASFDDASASAKLNLEGKFSFFRKRQTTINAWAYYEMFANDTIDRNAKFSVGLGQQVARKTYIHFTYSLIPHQYLYHFRDKDWSAILGSSSPEAFQQFDYSKGAFSFRILQYFGKRTSVTGGLEYERYFYNTHYTEYDSKRYVGTLRGTHEINDALTVTCAYTLGRNKAKGYDGDIAGETKQSSDDADDSFWENKGALGVQWYLPEIFGMRHSVGFNGSLSHKYYSTTKSPTIDKTHAGRLENILHASAAYTVSLTNSLAIQIEYARAERWAGSSFALNNDYIKEEKDYSKNVARLTLQYAFGK